MGEGDEASEGKARGNEICVCVWGKGGGGETEEAWIWGDEMWGDGLEGAQTRRRDVGSRDKKMRRGESMHRD